MFCVVCVMFMLSFVLQRVVFCASGLLRCVVVLVLCVASVLFGDMCGCAYCVLFVLHV